MTEIEKKLSLLPEEAGVYVMLNADKQIIYVGKAKNLKNRVRQYFYSTLKPEKVMAMVSNIADFYYILTGSENEAFTLENNLIKKNKPRYNILLKDDKTYPYLKIDLTQKFPYFEITRKIKKDRAKYYGPFMNGVSVSEMLDLINSVFNLRSCKKVLGEKIQKECLNYHIKLCNAPCAGKICQEKYMESVKKAIEFLEGNDSQAEQILTEKMNYFAQKEDYETAISYRDKLTLLNKIDGKKLTSLNRFINADIISYCSDGIFGAVGFLITRSGRMIGGNCYSLEGACLDEDEYLTSFIKQYYGKEKELPDEIYVNMPLSESQEIEEYFKQAFLKSVKIVCPKQGDKKKLTDLAYSNAKDYLERYIGKIKHKEDMTVLACKRLQEILSLKHFPRIMECFDISHTQGLEKVGSMAVFINGEKEKTRYRKFRIKTVEGNNDFDSLKEVLTRRLDRLVSGDEKFSAPDLIIIDGGKGQLSSVKEVFDKYQLDIDLISLAEREETVYTQDGKEVIIDHREYCLKLLQRIRDEAHRFAITFHKSLRDDKRVVSKLSEIEGLGKAKINALLKKFGSLKQIEQAKKQELMTVKGIGEALAEQIIGYFLQK